MKKKQENKDGVNYYDGSSGKLLELRSEGEEKGVVEAYLTKWDSVDTWGTKFKKGAFAKTFQKRGAKGTRLIWNHSELAGKILELREDSYGPFAKAQFNLETEAGKKAYAHVRAGDISCFSFGFNTVKDNWTGQVREITEVDMLECGPVVFEASKGAKVTAVRSTDFDETQAKRELNGKGRSSQNRPTPAEIITQVDTAIAKFHTAYIAWLNEFYDQYESREGKAPCEHRNTLQTAINSLDTEGLIKDTALTSKDVETMGKGLLLPVEERSKLLIANPVLAKAHQETRSKLLESLCDELRHSGLTEGEAERVEALTELNKKPSEIDGAIDMLREIRSNL